LRFEREQTEISLNLLPGEADSLTEEVSIDSFSSIFHTDATQVQAWEQFRVIDQGNCKYAIQTASGFYVGIYKNASGWTLLTTRANFISENEKFQLVVYGLASPDVLR
jgi:hypothetical protein